MKTLNCLLLSLFLSTQLSAQINVHSISIAPQISLRIDIVALARAAAYEKDFEKADRLLTTYNADHTDLNALALHAQVLYWMKSFDRSIDVYEKTIRLFPQPSAVHLDYARVLYYSNHLPQAKRLLKEYKQYDSTNVEAEIMLTYLELWKGRTGLAEKKANLLLQKYPGNADAKSIITELNNYTTPYFKTGIEMFSDDQPMKGTVWYAEAGMYKSWLFAPTAQVAINQFTAENSPYHSSSIQLANTMQLSRNNSVRVKAGIFQQNGKASKFTGGLEVSQKITRDFSLQAALEKRPYQFAVSSVQTIVMENVSALSLNYNRNNKWLGKASYEVLRYNDDNKIHTAYVWMLAPVISKPRFSFSAGYSFRYADALKSNFKSKVPVSNLVSTSTFNNVPGVYAPYFTPENQMVHAALASVKVVASRRLQYSSRLSIGVSATADNPYLYVGKAGNQFAVYSGFAPVDFMPANWVNELRLAVSNKFSITANYSYDKLLFYNSHRGGVELKYIFLK